MEKRIRLGTRGSALALTQSRWVAAQLEAEGWSVDLEIIHTTGDRIADRAFTPNDGKGVFVAEIERALLAGDIDVAVHSLKDLPGEMTAGLTLLAVPVREDPRDVLVGRTAPNLAALPPGAVIGTSSLRRRAQLHLLRPDVHLAEMRGNVDTRLRKLEEGQYDAICLAAAGLHRLGLAAHITEYFNVDTVIPAVGQGALAVQSREGDPLVADLLKIHDEKTSRAIRAERAVLAAIGGGCAVPLGVYAVAEGETLHLNAILCNPDGGNMVREQLTGNESPEALGRKLAEMLLGHRDSRFGHRGSGIEECH